MHALVHNRAATVKFPRAVPTDVVAIRDVSTSLRSSQSTVYREHLLRVRADLTIMCAVSLSKVNKQFDIVVFTCFNKGVAIFNADIHRFCGDDVFTAACASSPNLPWRPLGVIIIATSISSRSNISSACSWLSQPKRSSAALRRSSDEIRYSNKFCSSVL